MRERDAALAERDAARDEVARLKHLCADLERANDCGEGDAGWTTHLKEMIELAGEIERAIRAAKEGK